MLPFADVEVTCADRRAAKWRWLRGQVDGIGCGQSGRRGLAGQRSEFEGAIGICFVANLIDWVLLARASVEPVGGIEDPAGGVTDVAVGVDNAGRDHNRQWIGSTADRAGVKAVGC